jgi:hypothetical protein
MGFINDILNVMRKGPEVATQLNSVKLNTKTITRGAKDSTFQFPCLIADSVPLDMANTMSRTLDKVYASFTQTWLSMNSVVDITINPTPLDYLRKMHQNLKLEGSLNDLMVDPDDVESYMEKVQDGKYKLYMSKDNSYGVVFNISNKTNRAILESHKELLKEHLSEIDMKPLESFYEADLADKADIIDRFVTAQSGKASLQRQKDLAGISNGVQSPKLLDRDIKKTNDMVPLGVQVRLVAVNDKKEFVQYMDFVVGVKTIMHVIQTDDMVDNLKRGIENKSLLFKFLRWTTGEISLFKDIILNLDEIKNDTVKQAGKSPFFGTLQRLKNKKVGMTNFTVPHAIIPNATVVISSYEVDVLQNKYGIDIRKDAMVRMLMNNLFLMAFVIMDEGSGTVSVFYDGDQTYQTYSIETLERDNAMNSNKLGKEIGRMISR